MWVGVKQYRTTMKYYKVVCKDDIEYYIVKGDKFISWAENSCTGERIGEWWHGAISIPSGSWNEYVQRLGSFGLFPVEIDESEVFSLARRLTEDEVQEILDLPEED